MGRAPGDRASGGALGRAGQEREQKPDNCSYDHGVEAGPDRRDDGGAVTRQVGNFGVDVPDIYDGDDPGHGAADDA